MRNIFIRASKPTQEKVVELLEQMHSRIEKKGTGEAHVYFFTQLSHHQQGKKLDNIDRRGVDWNEVRDQIIYCCFEDHDMDGYNLIERRVETELMAFRALMELPRPEDDF